MKISVIIPVYNDKRVSKAIESVLNQKYSGEIEIIIIDGGSTDGTLEVLNKYKNHLDVLISEPDRGVFDAINKGIQLSTGDVVCFLGADDIYQDDKVFADVASVLSNSVVDACYGDIVYVDEKDRIIRYWKSGRYHPWKFYLGWAPPHPSVFVRKRIHDLYGIFDPRFQISDHELWIRLFLKYKINVEYIPRVLVRMTIGGKSNKSLANIVKANIEKAKAWWINKYYFGILSIIPGIIWKSFQFIKRPPIETH